ncbi:MAG: mechanosensitive ion channel family protein [Planctomycetota bacterium]|nr:MAG: mechanosensitive ion channel family protein [Planctomycetota bacterium]
MNEWLTRLEGWVADARLRAVLIVAGAFLLAKAADLIVCGLLKRLVRRSRTVLDDQAVALLHGPLVKTVVLCGFVVAVKQLGLDGAAAGEPRPIETVTLRVLQTMILLVWAGFAFRFVRLLLSALAGADDRAPMVQPRTLPLFDNLGKVLVFGLAVYALIAIWDLDATGWLASAGVVGLAVGFAAQDTLGNLFAGVFIIADAPFSVGDYIVLDSGERGQVVHIGLRSTRILTRDDIEITIPNAVIGKAKITNEAGGPSPRRRLRIPVGVAYGSDVDRVRRVLEEVAAGEELLCEQPAPRVRFRALGESSLDFELLAWIPHPELRGRAVDAVLTAIVKRFAAEGIEIPFPQRDLWVRSLPAAAADETGSGNRGPA